MRLITFTNLYPGPDMPRHGIFIRERLQHLTASGKATASVVALRPGVHEPAEQSAAVADIPVRYQWVPALPFLPFLTNWIDPLLWANAAAPAVREALGDDPEPAILDGHFLYPDGVAAVILGQRLGLPVVLSARGSDVNVKCRNLVMRKWVQWAVARCAAVITVSQALADRLQALGIEPRRLEVIPNGVDHDKFVPRDRAISRRRFGVSGRVIVSVGHLLPEKGHAIAIDALQNLPDTSLLIVGDGPRRGELQQQARRCGVAERVHFLGLVPHDEMSYVYSAADTLVLPSVREGMPNVILESLACGTRVAATDVGGIGEILQTPRAGVLMRDRSAAALAAALDAVQQSDISPEETRAYSRAFAWEPIVRQQLDLYESVLAAAPGAPCEPSRS